MELHIKQQSVKHTKCAVYVSALEVRNSGFWIEKPFSPPPLVLCLLALLTEGSLCEPPAVIHQAESLSRSLSRSSSTVQGDCNRRNSMAMWC
jgi:hypothetical protein